MDTKQLSLKKHYEWKGKLEVVTRAPVSDSEQLSIAYTPGVAQPCLEIHRDISKSFELTRRWNTVAVITDGSAVLGLGDIGPEAGMPVMEGKCCLFKEFGQVDAIPLCIRTKDVDELVRTVYLLSGSFGGINLEDISAPRCFEIERRLKELCDIPVFHDDQHGTAVVTCAALINALKVVGKCIDNVRCVINGAGSAGMAIADHLMKLGVTDILMCDSSGILYEGRHGMNGPKEQISLITNRERLKGDLSNAMCGADVFVGVSAPNVVTSDMINSMAKKPVVLAMSNPDPEIYPDVAIKAGAAVVGTGRSDFPNQINNVLAFPGIFRGALDARAGDINDQMLMAATLAIAELITDNELSADYIIPKAFDPRVGKAVAKAVSAAAIKSGASNLK